MTVDEDVVNITADLTQFSSTTLVETFAELPMDIREQVCVCVCICQCLCDCVCVSLSVSVGVSVCLSVRIKH